jgi:hypothetical protein
MPATAESQSETTSESLCFYIRGADLTRLMRDWVLEGRWPQAMQLLCRDLEGMTWGYAVQILTGSHTLAGCSRDPEGVYLAEQDQEDEELLRYRRDLLWQWAGTVLWKTKYWQPYAMVTNWGRVDLCPKAANRWITNPFESAGQDHRYRSLYYMDDPLNDYPVALDIPNPEGGTCPMHVLWRQVSVPPIWLTPHHRWRDGYRETLQLGRIIEERGYAQLDSDYRARLEGRVLDDAEVINAKATSRKRHKRDTNPMAQLVEAAMLPIDPETHQSIIDNITGEQDTESPIEPDRKFASEYGWIVPDGRFFPCRFMEHNATAIRMWKHLFGDPPQARADPQKTGEAAGWIMVTRGQLTRDVTVSINGTPTTKQRAALKRWGREHYWDIDNLIEFDALTDPTEEK